MHKIGNRTNPAESPCIPAVVRRDHRHVPVWREDELQRRLYQAEARYRALTEQLSIVTYVAAMNVQGSFTYISPQIEVVSGFKPKEWLADNRLWLQRMHPEDRRRILPMLGKAHRGGRNFEAEYRLLDRAGRAHWVSDESRAIRDEAGQPLFIQGTLTEITERKRQEQESAGQGRELMLSRSELEQFVSIASHELKAPLRRIVNLGELLASHCRSRLDAEDAALLDRMKGSATDMQELVAGLAEYAEAGPRTPLSAIELGRVLKHVLKELEGPIAFSGARITSGPLPTVWAEPTLLEQILSNLVDNALKFRSKDPPRIHISAERLGKDRIISIRDNGIGIHPRQTERIFSIFQRLHPRGEHTGVGLGLAICKKIIDHLGGRIWVESQPGEGSTFHFTLQAANREYQA